MCTTSEPKAADASEADCREGEWDRLVAKIGLLTLSAGMLEAAVMAMHCKATNQSEGAFKGIQRRNWRQRKGLKQAVKLLDWPDDKKADLTKRLSAIEALDQRRNALIHLAAGLVIDNSIHGISAGSAVDLRTYGVGVTKSEGTSASLNEDQGQSFFDWFDEKADLTKQLSLFEAFEKRLNALMQAGHVKSWTIGVVAKKIDLNEIDRLINDFQQARRGLSPYMELLDKIAHPPTSAKELLDRLETGKPLS
jgi:hypothetical protein